MKMAVIVGRFQVASLTKAHCELLREGSNYDALLIVIGTSPVRNTRSNPLPASAIAKMVGRYVEYGLGNTALIETIEDSASDVIWSRNLDKIIEKHLIAGMEPVLLGGRDSFIPYYRGEYPTKLINIISSESGTTSRQKSACMPILISEFRSGAIWAAYNRFPTVYSTVDIIAIDRVAGKILLGKKSNEEEWRFPGGFVDTTDKNLIAAAARELYEETGLDEPYSQFVYINSLQVEDWRYRKEIDVVMTHVFTCDASCLETIEAGDDLEQVKWVSIEKIGIEYILTASHQDIFNTFKKWDEQNG